VGTFSALFCTVSQGSRASRAFAFAWCGGTVIGLTSCCASCAPSLACANCESFVTASCACAASSAAALQRCPADCLSADCQIRHQPSPQLPAKDEMSCECLSWPCVEASLKHPGFSCQPPSLPPHACPAPPCATGATTPRPCLWIAYHRA